MLDLETALSDIQNKTKAQIERETAFTWASRAIVCYRLAKQSQNMARTLRILKDAEDYEHEAIEHAAMVRDGGVTLEQIEDALVGERST